MTGITDPSRMDVVELPDGRALAWAEWGAEDGRPVLLCPGAATSRLLGFGTEALEGLDACLVSLDRPGLGASDPAPNRTLLDWAADVGEFARARGLGAPPVVGHSQGAPFALACGAAGVVSAVAVVSGTDELAHDSFRAVIDDQLRGMIDLAREDPAAAEAMFASMNAETFGAMVMEMSSEHDRAFYEQPGFASAFAAAVADAFAQGAAGYARDTLLAMQAWPFDPADIGVPVDLWYGELDSSPVHSPDLGATLARRMPSARRHLQPDAGGALLWTHGAEILECLLTRARAPGG